MRKASILTLLAGVCALLAFLLSRREPARIAAPLAHVAEEAHRPAALQQEGQTAAGERGVLSEHHALLVLGSDEALAPYVPKVSVQAELVAADGTRMEPSVLELALGGEARLPIPKDFVDGTLELSIARTHRYAEVRQSHALALDADGRVRCALELDAHPNLRGYVQDTRGEPVDCGSVWLPAFGLRGTVDEGGAFELGPFDRINFESKMGAVATQFPNVQLERGVHRPLIVTPFEMHASGAWKDLVVVVARSATLRVRDARPENQRGPIELRVTAVQNSIRKSRSPDRNLNEMTSFGLFGTLGIAPHSPTVLPDGTLEFAHAMADVGLTLTTLAPLHEWYAWVGPDDRLRRGSGADALPLQLAPGEERTVELSSDGARVILHGIVLDAQDRAVAGAEVVVDHDRGRYPLRHEADRAGRFRIEFERSKNPKDVLRLCAFSQWQGATERGPLSFGYEFANASPMTAVRLDGSEAYELVLRLAPALYISGRVLDAKGQAWRGYVTAMASPHDAKRVDPRHLLSNTYVLTGGEGDFRLGPLESGNYEVFFAGGPGRGTGPLLQRTSEAGADLGDIRISDQAASACDVRLSGIAAGSATATGWFIPEIALEDIAQHAADPLGYLKRAHLPLAPNEAPYGMIGRNVASRPQRLKHVAGDEWALRERLAPGRYYALAMARTPQGTLPPSLLGPFGHGTSATSVSYRMPSFCALELECTEFERLQVSIRNDGCERMSFALPGFEVVDRLTLRRGAPALAHVPAERSFEIVLSAPDGSSWASTVPAGSTSWSANY